MVSCRELLLAAAAGGIVLGFGEAAVLQPGRRRRSLRAEHLGLEHGAVVAERLRRDVEVEPDAKQEVDLQVVHLDQADAPNLGEVRVVVASAYRETQAFQVSRGEHHTSTVLPYLSTFVQPIQLFFCFYREDGV